jgi:predicted regulator of amino acid metabolism with ACT domain
LKKQIFILSILGILFFAGCTGVSPEQLAMLDSSVQNFMSIYPDAELKVSLVRVDVLSEMSETIQKQCDIPLRNVDHWMVRVIDSESGMNLILWIEVESEDTVCVYQEGSGVITPPVDGVIDGGVDDVIDDGVDDVIDDGVDDVIDDGVDDVIDGGVDDVIDDGVEEPTITINDFEINFDKIELSSGGNKVSSVVLRVQNQLETQRNYRYDVVYQISKDGVVVVSDSSKKTLSGSDLIEVDFKSQSLYMGTVNVGTYDFEAVFYNVGSNTPLRTLGKEISIGPDAPSVIRGARSKPDIEIQEKITLRNVEFSFDSIKLSSAGNQLDGVILRVKNLEEAQKNVRYDLKFFIINEKGELIDVSSNRTLNLSSLIEVGFDSQAIYSTYKYSPGKYVVLAKLYNQGSNVSQSYIATEIEIGQDAPSEIFYDKEKIGYNKTEKITIAGDIEVSFDKIHLSSAGNEISKVDLKILNTGSTSKTISYDLKFFILNDMNELIDVSSNRTISKYNLTGSVIDSSSIYNTFKYSPSDYVLIAKVYNKGSNVSQSYITREIEIGPDAPSTQ